MKNKLLLFTILLSGFCFAQVTKVTYRLEIPVDESIAADYSTEIKRREVKDVFKYIDFELLFDGKRAKFYSPMIIESDDMHLREAAAYFDFGNPVYSIDGEQYFFGPQGLGIEGQYLVKTPFYKWQLHNETKTIAGYKCCKATYTWPGFSGTGPTHTAWYCPEIKGRYGPRGMGNLPGIILEFEYAGFIHTATKVEFKVRGKIEFPKDIKIITEQEYHKLWDEWERREMGQPNGN